MSNSQLGVDFAFEETFDNVGDNFGCHKSGWGSCATDMQWGESRDAAEHPTVDKTAHQTKNYLAQNINSANVRNPDIVYVA